MQKTQQILGRTIKNFWLQNFKEYWPKRSLSSKVYPMCLFFSFLIVGSDVTSSEYRVLNMQSTMDFR